MSTTCIRCGKAEAPQPLGYCPACAVAARVELVDALKRFSTYLSSWAAFEDWLRRRGVA
jgi:hypothetical protein